MAAASTAALTFGLLVPSASADQMGNLQAQAAALAARITALGNQEEALAERYDAAQIQLSNLQAQVASAEAGLAAAQSRTAAVRQVLRSEAIEAYVDGGANPLTSASAQGAVDGVLRAEYIDTLAGNQSDAIDQYQLASVQEKTAETQLKAKEAAAAAQLDSLNATRNAVSSAQAQLTAEENQVAGEIAQLKAQEAAAAAAAAAAQAAEQRQAAQQRAAALAAAQAQLQNAVGGGVTTVSYTVPPVGSGAMGAVRAAESRLGDWYQWGAAGPDTFDCSGLVMWAYAQVGISLPHNSGAQYNATTHIPISDVQPGDLVYFSDPGEHVAMYIGNGEIIEAPHTGAQVHIVPMYSGFVLASRVG